MLLVKNSLRYVNTMTFESILGVFLFKTGMFQRIKNSINFTKFKTWCSEVVGSAQYGCNSIFQNFSGETKNFAVLHLKIAMY